jgi:type IV pilus assembly protein PilV
MAANNQVRAAERGTTLLEAVVAMAVLLIGAVGVMGLHATGLRLNEDARKLTRATTIAQDLVDNINLWRWGDARLSDDDPGNSGDLGDPGFAFESGDSPPADHDEADLTAGGASFDGLTQAEIEDGNGFERYWNVAYVDDLDGDGIHDAMRIAVIVRWPTPVGQTERWRRIVVYTSKLNPAELR